MAKKMGRPRKTISANEKLEKGEAVKAHAERMKAEGYVFRGTWIKKTVWEEILRAAEADGVTSGEVIERAVLRVKKYPVPRNTPHKS